MSVSTFLHLEALEHAKQSLATYKERLETLIATDFEKAKADLHAVVSHYTGEITRIRSLIEPKVLAHLDEGQHPQTAVKLAEAGVPTQVEVAQKILAQQGAPQA